MPELLNPRTREVFAHTASGFVFVRYATPEEVALALYMSGGMGGLGEVSPATAAAPQAGTVNILGYDVPLWLLIAGAVGAYIVINEYKKPSRRVPNPVFGGLFGGGKKSGNFPGMKAYSVFFLPANGDGRDLIIQARNKDDARRKAKGWMVDEGEELRGAQFEIDALDE